MNRLTWSQLDAGAKAQALQRPVQAVAARTRESVAALIAAAGVAIGVAWSGLLANFAAGAFMVVLRPLKVGRPKNKA